MKIILKQEVDNLGLAGDVVDVADGYGRNFLLPRGLAIKATKGALKEAQVLTRARKAREAETLDDAQEQKEALESRSYRIPVRVDEAGHLYGSVRVDDVHRVIKERGHEIEKKRINLGSPIKLIGNYEIDVRVHPQVHATIKVEVYDEEGNVLLDEAGNIMADTTEPEPITLEDKALEAAAELEGVDEVESSIDPTLIDPDQPAVPGDLVEDETARAETEDAGDTEVAADAETDDTDAEA